MAEEMTAAERSMQLLQEKQEKEEREAFVQTWKDFFLAAIPKIAEKDMVKYIQIVDSKNLKKTDELMALQDKSKFAELGFKSAHASKLAKYVEAEANK